MSRNIALICLSVFASSILQAEEMLPWKIPDRLKELQEEQANLEKQLSTLPFVEDTLQMDSYGYHSSYIPVSKESEGGNRDAPLWTIQIPNRRGYPITELYLVPAADRRDPSVPGYGFPKRFCIRGVTQDGTRKLLFDWRNRPYPNPGRLPVRLALHDQKIQNIIIEVFEGCREANKEFFALDEIFVRVGFYLRSISEVTVSGSFEAPPFWSSKYLVDEKTSLGLPVVPLNSNSVSLNDFAFRFEKNPSESVILELDLGGNKPNGEIVLYPAQPPEGVFVPGYGFPKSVKVEVYAESEIPGERKFLIGRQLCGLKNPGNNIVRILTAGREGRWARFIFEGLSQYEGETIFGLGEIEITEARESMSLNATVTSNSFPSSALDHLQLLTDGTSSGRQVIALIDWLNALSERRRIHTLILNFSREEDLLNQRWNRFKRTLVIGTIFITLIFVVLLLVFSIIAHRKKVLAIKHRISRDLHDDVGSNLGSIQLVADRIKNSVKDLRHSDLDDLMLLVREASASLMDVIWVHDRETIRLSGLTDNLKKRAVSVLSDLELKVEIEIEKPDQIVSFSAKRQITMFFKEALNNCVRHANAYEVIIHLIADSTFFRIHIEDKGCGFDLDSVRQGCGIDSLKERAEDLDGTFVIQSEKGRGTLLIFTVPLKNLSKKSDLADQSSN